MARSTTSRSRGGYEGVHPGRICVQPTPGFPPACTPGSGLKRHCLRLTRVRRGKSGGREACGGAEGAAAHGGAGSPAARACPCSFYEGAYMERVIADPFSEPARRRRRRVGSATTRSIPILGALRRARRAPPSLPSPSQGSRVPPSSVWPYAPSPTTGQPLRALQKVVEGVLTGYGERWDDVERTFVCRYREMLLGFVLLSRGPR
ncbi:MAG: hypothetical protein ACLTDR_08950 [Adlercreutzia equolifaciens]